MADAPVRHESSAIGVPRVLGVGAILAVTVILVVIMIRAVLGHWVTPEHALIVARTATIPPTPRLQPHAGEDLARLRAQKQRLLSYWGWADAAHHFAHIPIDRAMTLYVQQHAATTTPGDGTPRPQDSTP